MALALPKMTQDITSSLRTSTNSKQARTIKVQALYCKDGLSEIKARYALP